MRNLIIIITVFFAFSCKNNRHPQNKIVQPERFVCAAVDLPAQVLAKRPRVQMRGQRNLLYLEFNGRIVSGTSWNIQGLPIVCDSSGFTPLQVDSVINDVRIKFDSLNVEITTDKKLFERSRDANKQVIIFTKSHTWYGTGAAGVAFIGSFGTTGDPAFVFTDLIKYSVHKSWKAACHELGHSLSLYHQAYYDSCTYLGDYRPGVLMGNGFGVANPHWTIGPNAGGCEYIQQDLKQMADLVGWKY